MAISKSKENILKKIRAALVEPTPVPFIQSEGNSILFEAPHDDLAVIFAEEFGKLDGKFVYVSNKIELGSTLQKLFNSLLFEKIYCVEKPICEIIENAIPNFITHQDLKTCDVAITSCEYLVARTGTIVLSSNIIKGRTASVYCPIHVCIAYASQMLYDVKDALTQLKEKYNNNIPSLVTFASGPSRTADIEKTLVKGIHGPKEVFCILVDD